MTLAQDFKGFISGLMGPIALGPVVTQYILAGTCGRGSCSLYSSHGNKKTDRKARGPHIPFEGTSPVT